MTEEEYLDPAKPDQSSGPSPCDEEPSSSQLPATELDSHADAEHGLKSAGAPPEVEQRPPSRTLAEACERLELQVPSEHLAGLEAYCGALWGWNEKINLTRHTDFDLFARRDLLDTVKLAAHLQPNHEILDIGTGGGVPGVVLAILRPDLTISVCDGVAKKAKVVRDIVQQLDLPVAVYASRAQDVLDDMRFHTLVTRAAGSITQLVTWVKDYWLSFDSLLAIKGPRWVVERKEARHRGVLNGVELRRIEAYNMPGTKNESVILQFRRNR